MLAVVFAAVRVPFLEWLCEVGVIFASSDLQLLDPGLIHCPYLKR